MTVKSKKPKPQNFSLLSFENTLSPFLSCLPHLLRLSISAHLAISTKDELGQHAVAGWQRAELLTPHGIVCDQSVNEWAHEPMADVASDAPIDHASENGVWKEAGMAWQKNGTRWGRCLNHGVLLAIGDGDGDLLQLLALVDDVGEGQDDSVCPFPVLEGDVELGDLANGANLDELL